MATKVALCNRALTRIGVSQITDITENTASAIACNAVFDGVMDELIERRPWSFLRRREALVVDQTVTLPVEWSYAYGLPSKTANIIGLEAVAYLAVEEYYRGGLIYSDTVYQGHHPGYEVRERILFSNVADAVLVYTASYTDGDYLTASFERAFTERLAAEVTMPLKDDERRYQALLQTAEDEASRAIAHDVNLQPNVINHIPDSIRVRG